MLASSRPPERALGDNCVGGPRRSCNSSSLTKADGTVALPAPRNGGTVASRALEEEIATVASPTIPACKPSDGRVRCSLARRFSGLPDETAGQVLKPSARSSMDRASDYG